MPRRPLLLRAALALALLAAGCATTAPPSDAEAPPGAEAPGAQAASEPGASAPGAPAAPSAQADSAPKASAPGPAAGASAPVAPAPKPKPWRAEYRAGSSQALLDGVLVYLDRPAKGDWRAKTARPLSPDRRWTVAPLLEARTNALVRGRKVRVCLDAGHGGADSGALSPDRRTKEKEMTLDVVRRLRDLLRRDGAFEILLSRPDDASQPTLEERPAKARRWRADLFVSVHFNANPGSAARGLETYVFPARGMESTSYTGRRPSRDAGLSWNGNASDAGNVQLGFCIHRRLLAATRLPDRGLRRARWIVLREATVPAVLVECGFLTSAKDLAYLRTEAGRAALARGLYEGICDFAFGTMAPGLPARTPETASAPPPASATDPATPLRRPPTVDFVRDETLRGPRTDLPAPPDDPATRGAREAALRAAGLAP